MRFPNADQNLVYMFKGGRSGTHSGSVRIYSVFEFSESKISAPFKYF